MNDHYYELYVKPSGFFPLFEDFLNDILPVGYEERDDAFCIRTQDDPKTVLWGIEQFAEALSKATGESVEIESKISKQKNSDWIAEYQKSITPIEVGKFYIHPTWEAPKEEFLNIAIDPALAFGTGHHPTTSTCLEAISKYVQAKMEVCDVGCGSGILGIAAAKLGSVVDGCDTDEASIENTKKNLQLNGVTFRTLWQGSIDKAKSKYDIIIANIVADVLVFLHNDLKEKLKKNDSLLILSGIMDKYEKRLLKRYDDFELVEKIVQDEWVTLVMKKREEKE